LEFQPQWKLESINIYYVEAFWILTLLKFNVSKYLSYFHNVLEIVLYKIRNLTRLEEILYPSMKIEKKHNSLYQDMATIISVPLV